ncbi:hypothetical protein K502DRAFT_339327 [Neoconidiobolus thromboides FSU 785]|nr:hypothetical protein K502DRAFT_339327 [Neoconidiobolus thromboides FSU 785]
MSTFTNFSPYTSAPEENRGSYQPIGDDVSSSRVPVNPEEGREAFNVYETSTPLPFDVEAALCYLLGCISGVLFLIIEKKNDYVRYHAWQACILGVFSLLLHFVFGLISSFLYYTLFLGSVVLSFFLAYRAYIDANTLVRFQLPYIGQFAAKWTDEE